jgi:hypothetical protein
VFRDVAVEEACWVRDRPYCWSVYSDGWRCQICQDWIPGTDLMVEHLFEQHSLAPVYTGVASMYVNT